MWDWHYKFAKFWPDLHKIDSNVNPEKVTLSGHKLTIFLILPVGFVIASETIIIEFAVLKFIHILSRPTKRD